MASAATLAKPAPVETAATVAAVISGKLRPLVGRIDADGFYPADVLQSLGAAGAYAHHTRLGGGDLAGAVAAMAEVGATCLSTAFCMWCQDALAWYLDKADNPAPRQRYLDAVASGRQLGGTGLSNPMKAFSGIEPLALRGVRAPGGYRVTGRLPFISNLDDGHLFGGIFALDDSSERRVMAVFRVGDAGVTLARNAHFIALEGTGTLTAMLRDAFVPDEDVIAEDAVNFVPRIRNCFVLLQAGMGLGVARGAARQMREDGPSRALAAHLPLRPDTIEERAAALEARVAAHQQGHEEPDRASFLAVLRTRLDISWLALEAAQAAVLQFGARGYLTGSETARRMREAQFVAIVTPSVKHISAELAKG